ncbi:NERD domain-containing protein [Rhodococcus sp. NPDC003348]
MVTRIPENPRLVNAAERTVWDALSSQLGDADLMVANQRVTDHQKDHEIDIVVAVAGQGIVTVEIKGGMIWHDGTDWYQDRRTGPTVINPVRQARDGCYALRHYVETDPRWTQGRLRWDHLVVFPNATIDAGFALPDCPRWKVIDRTELDQIAGRIWKVLVGQELDRPGLSDEGVEQLATALAGRGLPQRDVVARAVANEDAADALSAQQAVILDATRLLTRVEVRGGAGSGKTFLAVEQARRLAKRGQRVALLCYSHGLASYLRRVTANWNRKEKPAYVGEFHSLGRRWAGDADPDGPTSVPVRQDYWEYELPRQMTELAAALPQGERFDAVVIDEAQDFADAWWEPVLAALVDEETSGIYVFSDEGQRVFDRQGVPPVPLVPLVLDQNLRNTRQIAEAFGPLVGQRMRLRGGEGPQVRFVACGTADAVSVADDQVDQLIDAGWRPEDVALLVTGSRHPEQVERQQEGNRAYWDSFWDTEQVFYGHVLGFKGLERRAVVLAFNEKEAAQRSRERLYVGLSRARDQLVVCGDPDLIREVGGEELARRLGL